MAYFHGKGNATRKHLYTNMLRYLCSVVNRSGGKNLSGSLAGRLA